MKSDKGSIISKKNVCMLSYTTINFKSSETIMNKDVKYRRHQRQKA